MSFKSWDYKYFHIFQNNEAACVNCFSQIGLALHIYSNEYDGHFPAGGKTPIESLNLLFDFNKQETGLASCMASHAHHSELYLYYKKHKKISEELCCYRYNEGLTENAPVDSVLMYYYKPTYWATWDFPTKEKGRMLLFIDGHTKFYKEADFKKMQKATLKWIKKNKKGMLK